MTNDLFYKTVYNEEKAGISKILLLFRMYLLLVSLILNEKYRTFNSYILIFSDTVREELDAS